MSALCVHCRRPLTSGGVVNHETSCAWPGTGACRAIEAAIAEAYERGRKEALSAVEEDPRELEIAARLREATRGPWRPCPMKMFIFGPNHEMIASTSKGYPEDVEQGAQEGTVEIRGAGAGLPMDQNHDLIYNAPEDLEYLLGRLRALRKKVTT